MSILPHEPEGKATPTAADYEAAGRYLAAAYDEAEGVTTFANPDERAIAQALADQRADLLALFEEVAAEVETWPNPVVITVAAMIRQVGGGA